MSNVKSEKILCMQCAPAGHSVSFLLMASDNKANSIDANSSFDEQEVYQQR
jgi:hypothetical protein